MKIDAITKIYKLKNEEIVVLDNISLEFLEGKFYAIMGHSGTGKSTLIKIMGLMDTPTSGKYLIDGVDVFSLKSDILADIRMKKIGFVFQDFYLDEHLKAYENVMLPMLINKEILKEDRKKRALELLDKVLLTKRANHYPKELSGGEKQRIALARSLANNPKIILADEPTGNLDEDNERIVFEILKKLSKEGKCVVVVSHSDVVKDYADVVYRLQKGKLVKDENKRC